MIALLLQLAVLGVALAAAALTLVSRGLGTDAGLGSVLSETRPPRSLSSAPHASTRPFPPTLSPET